jgi:hypothetical protein
MHRGETENARAAIAEVVQLRDDGYEDIEVEDMQTHIVYRLQSMADLIRQIERRLDVS